MPPHQTRSPCAMAPEKRRGSSLALSFLDHVMARVMEQQRKSAKKEDEDPYGLTPWPDAVDISAVCELLIDFSMQMPLRRYGDALMKWLGTQLGIRVRTPGRRLRACPGAQSCAPLGCLKTAGSKRIPCSQTQRHRLDEARGSCQRDRTPRLDGTRASNTMACSASRGDGARGRRPDG